VTSSEDRTAKLWDAGRGSALRTFRHDHVVFGAEFSPDETLIVTRSGDKTAKLWDRHAGTQIATFQHSDSVWIAQFSRDGRKLLTSSADVAMLWDVGHVAGHTRTSYLDWICTKRLTGTTKISAGDASDPILRGRGGEDVCARGELSVAYWRSLLRDALTLPFGR
jgi:WD40 repeat protein